MPELFRSARVLKSAHDAHGTGTLVWHHKTTGLHLCIEEPFHVEKGPLELWLPSSPSAECVLTTHVIFSLSCASVECISDCIILLELCACRTSGSAASNLGREEVLPCCHDARSSSFVLGTCS